MSSVISPSALVEPGAQLGVGCELHPGAIVRRYSILGDRVAVHPYAVIGGDPQDLRFQRETESYVRVGAGTTLREYVTLNRATKPGGSTVIGEQCFLMATAHVAHDCQIGHHVIIANNVLLAGHVQIADGVFIGGGAAIHQFCRIGEGAMVAGLARITQDVPPYVMVSERDEINGLNVVGLKRRGLPRESMRELKEAFRCVFSTAGNIREIAARRLASGVDQSDEAKRFLTFFAGGKRGFVRPRREIRAESDEND